MYNRPQLIKELMRDEGLRLEVYPDSVGLWTIGVGHLLGNEKRMTRITMDEATALLVADIGTAEDALDKSIPFWAELDDVRQRALMNMSFNLGNRLAGFAKFRLALSVGNWEQAKEQMLNSKWADQVGSRADRLAEMIEKGV